MFWLYIKKHCLWALIYVQAFDEVQAGGNKYQAGKNMCLNCFEAFMTLRLATICSLGKIYELIVQLILINRGIVYNIL